MHCDHAVIINDFSIARGGATAMALLSAERLRGRGLSVTFFSGEDAPNTHLEKLGIKVVSVGGKPLLEQSKTSAMRSGIFNADSYKSLATLIETKDTPKTVYHVHAWSLILSPSVFKALQKVSTRVFIHSHDQFLACPNGVYFDFKKQISCERKPLGLSCVTTNCDKRSYVHKGWRVLRQSVLSRTLRDDLEWGGVIVIHPKMEARLKRFGYENMTMATVRNPIISFSGKRVPVEENTEFFFVGRVEADKGVLEFAQAVTEANVPATIIGDGPLLAQIKADFPNIICEGWCEKEAISPLMQRARAVVMPSRFAEPFGLVAVEAIQSGVPVIVPDDAFLGAEITAAGVGITCDIHNPKSFENAIGELRDLDASEIRRMSEKGIENKAPMALSADQWTDALIALYDAALERA